MLLLLVKKMEILFYSVSFSPPNSSKSITYSLNFAYSIFLAEKGYKEATSETNEELQGADESYWTVFPVKFTE